MEPEVEAPDNNHNLVPWSGSDGSQELCASESLAESFDEDDISDEDPLDPEPPHTPKSDPGCPERPQPQEWESAGEQQSLAELSGSDEDVSYKEEDNIYLSESRESPHIQTSPVSLSPHKEHPDSEPQASQTSPVHSPSSSSSLGYAADLTLALTLTTEEPQGASNRQDPAPGNRRIESSEEGGSSEAPPAPVFFEISDEGAEQAEKWNSESATDLCRPDRHRGRYTRLIHSESQSERHVKETKSKCKRIARLLTDAPNPQNKGALLFKKRRQRVKKYTLVSYGTGNRLHSEDQIEEESEEVRSAAYNFVATSDSELEEEYSVYHQQRNLSLNWGGVQEMEALPETKGKGVMMFVQRRRRMDEIMSEHEEMRNKGLPVEALTEPECTEAQTMYDTKEMYMLNNQADYMDASHKQHEYQENIQQMNHLANVPRPLVPNRTARPFLGFQGGTTAAVMPGGAVPVTRKNEPRFKVSVPINTIPHVWSPTGDIIASRDERISVPAIKSGMLPESKRKGTKKQSSALAQESNPHLQRKGERRSYIESEEDCFSLGAEACNFMQPRTIKLKNPPPVAPKPTINPSCPPWMSRSPSAEPYIPPRSPVSQPSHSPGAPHSQHYLQQQDWAQQQQMVNRWAPDQTQATLQTPANAWAPVNPSPQLHLQPTTNSWNQQPSRSPVSIQARSPTYSPHHPPSPSRNKSDSVPNSVASCPPKSGKSYVHAPKAAQPSPKGRVSDRGVNRPGDGSTMAGKGAQLFARRQSRMEKFVVDAETVQANKRRSPSPASSLPNFWRYSSNVRAPPPLSYNPLLAPFYPPSAAKQPPPTSSKVKTKEKPKAPQKHLNALDIMKHQPYQLDSSLFKYDAVPEAKSPSPSPNPKPTPASKFEAKKSLKLRSASSPSTYNTSELAVQAKAEAPTKYPGSGFGRSRSLSLPRRLNSMPSPRLLSPGTQGSFLPAQRQMSFQESAYKPLSPWEAASKSPIGAVDEAFLFQSLPSSVASNVKAAGQRMSLPEPPDEWKRRVSLDPAAVSRSHYHAAPGFQAPSLSRTFSPEKAAFYGPPFRPAQPLRPANIGYMGQGPGPTKYSPLYTAAPRS
ncbi:synaptopodin-2 [Hippoglossus hippoglossus]|uniref:synaptopodin-2 n=1 Tax=Hippoglossus hippoglossus TaxID=8267 RepID=UPI00148C43F1|nr:synaptopodin-2 [Hippoglossus hippoglossus]